MHLDDRLNGQGPWSIVHFHSMYVKLYRTMVHSKFSLLDSSRKLMLRRTSTKYGF